MLIAIAQPCDFAAFCINVSGKTVPTYATVDLESKRIILIIELWSLLRHRLLFVMALPVTLFVVVIFPETALGCFLVNVGISNP